MAGRALCPWQDSSERQIDLLELPAEMGQFSRRKGREKPILDGLRAVDGYVLASSR
jgi:hypothetical protein